MPVFVDGSHTPSAKKCFVEKHLNYIQVLFFFCLFDLTYRFRLSIILIINSHIDKCPFTAAK